MSSGEPVSEESLVRPGGRPATPGVSYILPLRAAGMPAARRLDPYLDWLAGEIELIVVDGSPRDVFDANHRRWRAAVHVRPSPGLRTANGKAWGVLTGLSLASHENVIVADDDVRYDTDSLARVVGLLDRADVVRPQNYFSPAPWHARWDTARSLVNRACGGDWPGTLAVRRPLLRNGYDGDCLFENLEMVRTVRAAGGRELVALDTFVRRLPPSSAHFLSQRVRQAYDEWARPGRFLLQLAVLPAVAASAGWRPRVLLTLAAASILVAELGRRRGGGASVWPPSVTLYAPLWVAERAICAWLALLARVLRGGIRYHGALITRSATPARLLVAAPPRRVLA